MAKKTTTFLAIILTLNNFVLNCKQDPKVKGCDMGMVCAPLHANIFMDHFENKCIYTFLQGTTLTYLQFIDDIFFILQSEKNIPAPLKANIPINLTQYSTRSIAVVHMLFT